LGDGQRAQTVVAAQLENDDLWVVKFERARQTREPAGSGLAADAGIDDLVTVPCVLSLVLSNSTQPCSTRASP